MALSLRSLIPQLRLKKASTVFFWQFLAIEHKRESNQSSSQAGLCDCDPPPGKNLKAVYLDMASRT